MTAPRSTSQNDLHDTVPTATNQNTLVSSDNHAQVKNSADKSVVTMNNKLQQTKPKAPRYRRNQDATINTKNHPDITHQCQTSGTIESSATERPAQISKSFFTIQTVWF